MDSLRWRQFASEFDEKTRLDIEHTFRPSLTIFILEAPPSSARGFLKQNRSQVPSPAHCNLDYNAAIKVALSQCTIFLRGMC